MGRYLVGGSAGRVLNRDYDNSSLVGRPCLKGNLNKVLEMECIKD